jgi:ribonuclease P protein component
VLKKINRLQKRSDFEMVSTKGKLVPGSMLGMLWLNEGGGEENKYGFVISKRVSKRAVDRNRIKRLLSEAVKINLEKTKGRGYKIVFLAKRAMVGKKMTEVAAEVEQILGKIK